VRRNGFHTHLPHTTEVEYGKCGIQRRLLYCIAIICLALCVGVVHYLLCFFYHDPLNAMQTYGYGTAVLILYLIC